MTDFGRRVALHKVTHGDAGVDEVVATGLEGRVNYVDRGDPATGDFSQTTLTTDGQWHDLDLSAIVPPGAVAIHFLLFITDNATNQNFSIRKKGNSNIFNRAFISIIVADMIHFIADIIPCNSDRFLEYKASNTTFTAITLTVKGWFI